MPQMCSMQHIKDDLADHPHLSLSAALRGPQQRKELHRGATKAATQVVHAFHMVGGHSSHGAGSNWVNAVMPERLVPSAMIMQPHLLLGCLRKLIHVGYDFDSLRNLEAYQLTRADMVHVLGSVPGQNNAVEYLSRGCTGYSGVKLVDGRYVTSCEVHGCHRCHLGVSETAEEAAHVYLRHWEKKHRDVREQERIETFAGIRADVAAESVQGRSLDALLLDVRLKVFTPGPALQVRADAESTRAANELEPLFQLAIAVTMIQEMLQSHNDTGGGVIQNIRNFLMELRGLVQQLVDVAFVWSSALKLVKRSVIDEALSAAATPRVSPATSNSPSLKTMVRKTSAGGSGAGVGDEKAEAQAASMAQEEGSSKNSGASGKTMSKDRSLVDLLDGDTNAAAAGDNDGDVEAGAAFMTEVEPSADSSVTSAGGRPFSAHAPVDSKGSSKLESEHKEHASSAFNFSMNSYDDRLSHGSPEVQHFNATIKTLSGLMVKYPVFVIMGQTLQKVHNAPLMDNFAVCIKALVSAHSNIENAEVVTVLRQTMSIVGELAQQLSAKGGTVNMCPSPVELEARERSWFLRRHRVEILSVTDAFEAAMRSPGGLLNLSGGICSSPNSLQAAVYLMPLLPVSRMQVLDLRGCLILPSFVKSFCDCINLMTNLKQLQMANSSLDVSVVQRLRVFDSLHHLDLYENQLTELPFHDSVVDGAPLVTLDACHNQISVIPDFVGLFKQLQVLNLCHNELVQLPECLTNCQQLIELDVSHNHLEIDMHLIKSDKSGGHGNGLKTWPPTSLLKLQTLKIQANCLAGLPENIGALAELAVLICGNQIQNHPFSIPDSLGNCDRLKTFEAQNVGITSLPEGLFDCMYDLELLNLEMNKLETTPDLTNCINIRKVMLRVNRLPSGDLPAGMLTARFLEAYTLDNPELLDREGYEKSQRHMLKQSENEMNTDCLDCRWVKWAKESRLFRCEHMWKARFKDEDLYLSCRKCSIHEGARGRGSIAATPIGSPKASDFLKHSDMESPEVESVQEKQHLIEEELSKSLVQNFPEIARHHLLVTSITSMETFILRTLYVGFAQWQMAEEAYNWQPARPRPTIVGARVSTSDPKSYSRDKCNDYSCVQCKTSCLWRMKDAHLIVCRARPMKDVLEIRKENEIDAKAVHWDTSYKTGCIDTPLTWAARQGRLDVVDLMLEVGADISKKGLNNATVLSVATQKGHVDIIKRLLIEKETRELINERNSDGQPIVIAYKTGRLDIVEMLKQVNGVDLSELRFCAEGKTDPDAKVLVPADKIFDEEEDGGPGGEEEGAAPATIEMEMSETQMQQKFSRLITSMASGFGDGTDGFAEVQTDDSDDEDEERAHADEFSWSFLSSLGLHPPRTRILLEEKNLQRLKTCADIDFEEGGKISKADLRRLIVMETECTRDTPSGDRSWTKKKVTTIFRRQVRDYIKQKSPETAERITDAEVDLELARIYGWKVEEVDNKLFHRITGGKGLNLFALRDIHIDDFTSQPSLKDIRGS